MAEWEDAKQRRAARFASDASKPPPPVPKKVMAHPGGRMTSNKDEATAKFLARRGHALNPHQCAALDGLETRPDKIFIGNLPFTFDSSKLSALFEDKYAVVGAKIVCDRATNKSRGYGFVTFEHASDAARAVEGFRGTRLQGRELSVKFAELRGQTKGPKQKMLPKDAGWGSWAAPKSQARLPPEPTSPLNATAALEANGDALDATVAAVTVAAVASPRARATKERPDDALNREKPAEASTVEPVSLWTCAAVDADGAPAAEDGSRKWFDADAVKHFAKDAFPGAACVLLFLDAALLPADALWLPAGAAVPAAGLSIVALGSGKFAVRGDAAPASQVERFPIEDAGNGHAFPAACVNAGPRPQDLGGFTIRY